MKRFAIFDLDGTLLNTLDDLAAACNYALTEENLPTHPIEAFRMFVGNGIPKLIERITPKEKQNDIELLKRLREKFDTYYSKHGQDFTKPYDGIISLLDKMLEQGMRLAILSNKAHGFAIELVPHYFGERFTAVLGQKDGLPTKPDGSLVEKLLEELGATKDETIYLGDSGTDMQTAKNGGVFSIGVLWGFRGKEELLENGAKALISMPQQALDFIN